MIPEIGQTGSSSRRTVPITDCLVIRMRLTYSPGRFSVPVSDIVSFCSTIASMCQGFFKGPWIVQEVQGAQGVQCRFGPLEQFPRNGAQEQTSPDFAKARGMFVS
jgi:hypothetical protein